MRPVLQARWKLSGHRLIYYGMRALPHLFHNVVRINSRECEILQAMDGNHDLAEFRLTRRIQKLIREDVIVDAAQRRNQPRSLAEARYCRRCVANDYMLPGLELDDEGLCPMCATAASYRHLKNILPVVSEIPRAQASRYDVAVLYTGGKDSSYLVYYLSRILKLRVLALTWLTPFMSGNALQSIGNARESLPEVVFISQSAPPQSLAAIYRSAVERLGNTCICPSVAYVLFYPLLVREKVPFLVLGNEPVQAQNLLYNQIVHPFCLHPAAQHAVRCLVNTGRVLTLRRPLRPGQMEMLTTVKNLAMGSRGFLRLTRYQNEIVAGACEALQQVPDFMREFRVAVRRSGRRDHIPALVHLDLAQISGDGHYHWESVKKILTEQIGWVDAPQDGKGLHTSCMIEKCKDWTQHRRFLNMASRIMPFSAIELSLAVGSGCLSREAALLELQAHSGFQTDGPAEMAFMMKACQS